MPTSAPGSRPGRPRPACAATRAAPLRGFTLIEVMVVLALIAIAVGVVSLSLRDGAAPGWTAKPQRLAACWKPARAEARATGRPGGALRAGHAADPGRHAGSASSACRQPPHHAHGRWLDPEVVAQVGDAGRPWCWGPKPLIGRQRVLLRIDASAPRGRHRRPAALHGADSEAAPCPAMRPAWRTRLHADRGAGGAVHRGRDPGRRARAAGALTDNAERLAQVTAAHWCADNQLTNLRLARSCPASATATSAASSWAAPMPAS
jgi:general secretion pathway protein H